MAKVKVKETKTNEESKAATKKEAVLKTPVKNKNITDKTLLILSQNLVNTVQLLEKIEQEKTIFQNELFSSIKELTENERLEEKPQGQTNPNGTKNYNQSNREVVESNETVLKTLDKLAENTINTAKNTIPGETRGEILDIALSAATGGIINPVISKQFNIAGGIKDLIGHGLSASGSLLRIGGGLITSNKKEKKLNENDENVKPKKDSDTEEANNSADERSKEVRSASILAKALSPFFKPKTKKEKDKKSDEKKGGILGAIGSALGGILIAGIGLLLPVGIALLLKKFGGEFIKSLVTKALTTMGVDSENLPAVSDLITAALPGAIVGFKVGGLTGAIAGGLMTATASLVNKKIEEYKAIIAGENVPPPNKIGKFTETEFGFMLTGAMFGAKYGALGILTGATLGYSIGWLADTIVSNKARKKREQEEEAKRVEQLSEQEGILGDSARETQHLENVKQMNKENPYQDSSIPFMNSATNFMYDKIADNKIEAEKDYRNAALSIPVSNLKHITNEMFNRGLNPNNPENLAQVFHYVDPETNEKAYSKSWYSKTGTIDDKILEKAIDARLLQLENTPQSGTIIPTEAGLETTTMPSQEELLQRIEKTNSQTVNENNYTSNTNNQPTQNITNNTIINTNDINGMPSAHPTT